MNLKNLKQLSTAFLAGAAFLGAVIHSQAQIIATSYTNSFDTGLFSLPTHKKSTII